MIDKMTLAEIEELAARLSAAATIIRNAQSLLGGSNPAQASMPNDAMNLRNAPSSAHPGLDSSERAERDRLLARIRQGTPMTAEDNAAAMRDD